MKRSGPLKRTGAPMRRTRLAPVSKKRKAQGAERRAVVDQVLARDGNRCVVCRREGVDPHHVWRQSQGGPWEPWCLISLCRVCHSWVHDHDLLAQSMGLLVPSWTGREGCDAAQLLRLKLRDGFPTFAPWLDDSQRAATQVQDKRWLRAAPLEGWRP